jgi:hypothetical protein
MATKPTEIVVRKGSIAEIRGSLELLDNPNSTQPNEKPTRYRFKNQSVVRYDLAMNYREVSEHARAVEKVHNDMINNKRAEQLEADPDAQGITGKWLQDLTKEVNAMREETVTLSIRQIPLSSLDLETNNLPFTAIGNLIGNVITDDTAAVEKED